MPVDAVTGAGSAAFGTVANKDKLGQAQFMQLMIAQLRNQDPTKPMRCVHRSCWVAPTSWVTT
jgi:flagellar hook assembly protein FlgD